MLNLIPLSDIDIVAPDGTVRHRTKGNVHPKVVMIQDSSVVICPGDEIRRLIPSGVEETYEVIDPVLCQNSMIFPSAYYQVKVKRKGAYPRGQGGNYNIHHVHASGQIVNIGSQDRSTNIAIQGDVFGDISAALQGVVKDADELHRLLSAVDEMKRQRGGAGFAAAYRSFVSLAADHLGVLAPFLPALSQFLSG